MTVTDHPQAIVLYQFREFTTKGAERPMRHKKHPTPNLPPTTPYTTGTTNNLPIERQQAERRGYLWV